MKPHYIGHQMIILAALEMQKVARQAGWLFLCHDLRYQYVALFCAADQVI